MILGVKAFRHRHALGASLREGQEPVEGAGAGTGVADDTGGSPPGARSVKPVTGLRAARQGVLVGLTNPKAAVFFGAILPQFVDRARGDVPLQMILFATMFSTMALVCDSSWGLAAGTARDWFARSPRRLAMVGGAGGLAMVGLGVGIAVTGRKD